MAAVNEIACKPDIVGVGPQDFSPSLSRAQSQPVRDVQNDCGNPSLRRWRVMEVVSLNGTRSRHVYGHDVTNDTGRASSAIKEFDLEAMTATTRSGRSYQLVGAPGNARSGEYAWQHWCRINGVASEVDVTSQYFSVDKLFPHKDEI